MKALQDHGIFFAYMSDDPMPLLILADAKTAKTMVEFVNNVAANIPPEIEDDDVSGELWRKEEFSLLMLKWLSRFYRYGISKKMLQELNAAMVEIKCSPWIYTDENDGYVLTYAINFDQIPPVESAAALFFSSMALNGELNGLKRCESHECRKFYVGNAKAKWCSDTCGSRERLRKKRKRDRERGMLCV